MKGKSFKSIKKNSKNTELWLALWNIKKCEAYRKENHKINRDAYYDNKHMKETIINKISTKSKPQSLPDLKNGLKTKHESSKKEETKNKETYKIALPKRRIFNHKKILPLNSIYPLKFRQHISRFNRNNDNLRKI
jgi:diacylglycerol kinase family enzyme